MINFILISHGDMAKGTLDAAEMILGKQDGIQKIDLKEGDSIDSLRKRIEEKVIMLNQGADGILMMVDLFGASPFNMACVVAAEYDNVDVISGFNLPMLLETIIHRDRLRFPELISLAKSLGREGISVFSELDIT